MAMRRQRRTLVRRAGSAIATGLTLMVFIVPTLVAGWWFASTAHVDDPRKIVSTVAFKPRAVDSVRAAIRPFKEPIVSVTFDDGWESVYTQAFPVLQRDGIRSTQYIITKTMDNPLYMSEAQLRAMRSAGHQIASHTVTHPDLTTLDASALVYELATSQKVLQEDFGGKVADFTTPYGAYNAYTLKVISKYYRSQKNAEGTDNPYSDPRDTINTAARFNPLNFTSYSIHNDTKPDDIQRLLDETRRLNGWLVLTFHQIDKSNEEYSVTPAMFGQMLDIVTKSGMRSATVGEFMDAYFQQVKK